MIMMMIRMMMMMMKMMMMTMMMMMIMIIYCIIVVFISGVLYVVDSADRERIDESREELMNVLNSDEMRYVPVCVLANKQDLPGKLI